MRENIDLCFNGVDGPTGQYLIEPCKPEQFLEFLGAEVGNSVEPDLVEAYQKRQQGLMRPAAWVNACSLAQTGWGVVFPRRFDPAIKEALEPLLKWREQQAGERYCELLYEAPKTELQFLAEHGKGPGPVDPKILPYYLLLVGNPKQIPFGFQFQLDVDFAVGRLELETLEDYERYAKAVVRAEKQKVSKRRATFFGVSNPDDQPTAVSQKHLVEPLADDFEKRAQSGWEVERIYGGEARKKRLREILESPSTAGSLLFTASHGVGFKKVGDWQRALQGAILCADWPGPRRWPGGTTEEFYFSADDLSDEAKVEGAIIMAFACHSAGTPQMDTFHYRKGREAQIAPCDFVARLPQRLLARGALAFVGHVDRAWTFSFYWPEAKAQCAVFKSTLVSLLQGRPIGDAMDYFGARYAKLATSLVEQESRGRRANRPADSLSLISLWTAYHDARSYVILGDPATRLAEAEGS